LMFIIVIIVLLFDQLTKALALKNITYGTSIPIINNIFHLTLVKNTGSAFGLFKDSTVIFILVAILSAIFILRFLFLKREALDIRIKIALFLVLGGALGNLIDRLRFGYVIDFLDFRVWPVFNLADSCITIGAGLLVYDIITAKRTRTAPKT
jgi:signal peptidase II